MCVSVCLCIAGGRLDTRYIHECLCGPSSEITDQPRCSCGYVTYVMMFVVCS